MNSENKSKVSTLLSWIATNMPVSLTVVSLYILYQISS